MAMGVVGVATAIVAPILVGLTVWFMTTRGPLLNHPASLLPPKQNPPTVDSAWRT